MSVLPLKFECLKHIPLNTFFKLYSQDIDLEFTQRMQLLNVTEEFLNSNNRYNYLSLKTKTQFNIIKENLINFISEKQTSYLRDKTKFEDLLKIRTQNDITVSVISMQNGKLFFKLSPEGTEIVKTMEDIKIFEIKQIWEREISTLSYPLWK
ncbi:MAG: hypothetical protein A3F40_02345 [Chlamydiae bacterium RIFCSPHIGHO2_12_FULL_27_8]|nr:MAG: hypothetical protein A3F40_02345 [Chlamydiae bacterium RIFCSPHIGHO2_12_FULL_27_8]